MNVLILCGGKGSRMREESEFKPKPLVEVGGRPVLWHIMKLYAHHGFRDFVLALGYKGNLIKEYFLNYDVLNNDCTIRLGSQQSIEYHDAHEEQDFQVVLADTGADALTGSRVKKAAKYIGGDTFMVTYGDGVSDVNIPQLLAFHRAHGKLATMTTVRPTSRFGLLDVDAEGRILTFAEKPTMDTWANAGFFVFERGVLDYVDDGDLCALEDEPLKRLVQDKQIAAYRHEGFFYAMDTYREYLHLNALWDRGEAQWAVWAKRSAVAHVL
ncbi:glucose-1-phosphate cytidylyltransferase [Candidatus Peregrinibacteria bacterium]|nr:glucose-1-phosphate cytidylyltransferase [Candidatus Peregrinibacteria bacterium]